MSCEVCVYDQHLVPEKSTSITLSAYDPSGGLLDSKASRARPGGDYGALLSVHKAFEVVVDDTSLVLAPVSLSAFNGNHSLRLEVVLYPLPAGGSGVGAGGSPQPQTMGAVRTFVGEQVQRGKWNAMQAAGAQRLVLTAAAFSAVVDPKAHVHKALVRWRAKLTDIGIGEDFLQRPENSENQAIDYA